MRYLNLDPTFSPGGTSDVLAVVHEVSTFKGGEEHIKISGNLNSDEPVIISTRAVNSTNVMRILLAHDALQRLGVKHISLCIWYLPYARQDRVMNPGESLSTKVFANLINSCNFDQVQVLDPHSDVGPALLNNVAIMDVIYKMFVANCMAHVRDLLTSTTEIAVISPDSGAYKKIYKTCKGIDYTGQIVLCNKARNLATNEIEALTVIGDVEGKACVIIDDICDGGRTFAELGAQLKEQGAALVYLIVTHGILSYGEEQLKPHIDHMWMTNSFRDYESDFVTLVRL